MNAFTPIRLIQPQNPEQQRAIQSLVQELQKSAPQLFANIGQPGSQQLALALPMNPVPLSPSVGMTPASQVPAPAPVPAPVPAPAPTPMPVAPSPLLPSPVAPVAPTAQPFFASSAPPAPPPAFTAAAAPPPPPMATSSIGSVASAPFSFAINAMFRSTEDPSPMPTVTTSLPFGLHFDSTWSSSEDWSSGDSDSFSEVSSPLILLSTRTRHQIHHSHKTASEHGSAANSDIEEELSGLENSALKNSMSLVAMVVTSVLAMAALL
ncbi:hypothetical protein GGF42_001506 [Coemansia sp. RSA 2424]|nr:hypothetical protein GGF42_001506 [Coemansia sp. RSA 2424]